MPRDPYDIWADDVDDGIDSFTADAHAFRGVPSRRPDPDAEDEDLIQSEDHETL